MQFKKSMIFAAMAGSIAFAAAAQQELVVRIGHVAPTSGPQAHYGKDNENGARMAIEDLNKRNITVGGRKVRWVLQAEDDAADPKQGTAAAQKLVDAKVNAVVGHLNSGTTLPASAIYNQAGIPQITPSATNPRIAQQGFNTFFRILANDNALGAGLALYGAKSLSAKNVAVIDDRTAYGQGVADVFARTAEANGMKIVAREFTNDKATDFNAILTKIRAANPDIIFYGGMDPQAGPMLRQMKALGINAKFMGGDGICTDKLTELSGGANNDTVFCAEGGASLAKMPGGTEWRKRYDAQFPGQFQVYSPYVYDAVMMIADAVQKAGSAEPARIREQLAKIDYQGVTARIGFDSIGEIRNPAMTIYTYRGGKKIALN
ncbi:branched-chain amino acid ABC transporter substrate-binding protein [Piscinibacterium candidicorallinum]|jgi:branched-chain amino acid transport system substrate-binding protein|uniref:Branched-chain amino acid ABC transporter substrate-binding protein n=1 Tax=Piscinibacterium candidicorallinum TaxID=1793872 RepID=A0ABV7H1C6_9BURK